MLPSRLVRRSWGTWFKSKELILPFHYFFRLAIYLFMSKVDSSWKTWARENTVLVFFFLLFCEFGEALSVFRPSVLSSSSSSIISCSSSDSLSLGKYVWCDCGLFEGADGGGVSDGERFSALLVELSAEGKARKLVIMGNCVRQVLVFRLQFLLIVLLVNKPRLQLEASQVPCGIKIIHSKTWILWVRKSFNCFQSNYIT